MLKFQFSRSTSHMILFGWLLLASVGFLALPSAMYAQSSETNLGDVTVRFCNDPSVVGGTKAIELSTETNKEEELCIYMNNAGATPVKLAINFVDGSTTADAEAKKACGTEWEKTNFGQYVQVENSEFLIQPRQTLQTKAIIKFPSGIAGKINGCITYHLIAEEEEIQGMFRILSRRANFIDVIVSGDAIFNSYLWADQNPSTPNLVASDKVKMYADIINKSVSLKSYIINSGNLNSETVISGNIEWWFWLFKHQIPESRLISSSRNKTIFEYKLPKWTALWGPLKLSIHAVHTPQFPDGFEKDNVLPITESIDMQAWILPRWIYLVFGSLIVLVIINRKKSNK